MERIIVDVVLDTFKYYKFFSGFEFIRNLANQISSETE
jgi:hypothetical protein